MKFLPVFLFAIFLCVAQPAHAQLTVTEDTPMSFGTFVIRNLNVVGTVTVNPQNNQTSANTNIILLSNGQRGEFSITGGPASTNFTVTVTSSGLTFGGGGGTALTIGSIEVRPVNLKTNGAGVANFTVGATLSSAGDGSFYTDGTYSEGVDFLVQF
jgi:hypothetical protein